MSINFVTQHHFHAVMPSLHMKSIKTLKLGDAVRSGAFFYHFLKHYGVICCVDIKIVN